MTEHETIRDRVERGMRREKRNAGVVFLAVNILMLVVFSLITVLAFGTGASTASLSPEASFDLAGLFILPFIGWLMSIIFQAVSVAMSFGLGDRELRARILSREMADDLMLEKMEAAEKVKREDAAPDGDEEVMLSEDGELVRVRRERRP